MIDNHLGLHVALDCALGYGLRTHVGFQRA